MKKKLIYSTAIAALFSASAVLAGGPDMVVMPQSPFDGFYIGGSIGLHQTGFDMSGDFNFVNTLTLLVPPLVPFNITLASQTGGGSSTDTYGGIQGGYGRVFANRYYAGIEGFGQFGSASDSITTTILPVIPGASLTNSAKVGDTYGVAARLGILLSPTTLAYAKLGVEWADVSATVSTSFLGAAFQALPSTTGTHTSSSFLWGFGVEQFVWKDVVSLFAEYTYANFGSASTTSSWNLLPGIFFPVPPNFFGFQVTNTASANVSSFTGGLNFHFGRNWF